MKMKKLMSGIVAGTVALSAFASMSFATSAEDAAPIHTFKTAEKAQTNKTKTAANKVIKNNLTTWATAFADGSGAYSIANPWDNDLFDMKNIDSFEFVITSQSNNFNGSIGFACGPDYDWCQIGFDAGPAINAYWAALEEEEVEPGDTFEYTDEDQTIKNSNTGDEVSIVETVEVTETVDEEVSTYTFKFTLGGFQDAGFIGNTKGGEVKLAINGMNAACTEPTVNGSGKYDWTELSTEAYLVEYKIFDVTGAEIYDAADPEAHKLPTVEGSGVWTDKGEGTYAYAWGGEGQAVNLADVADAKTTIAIPEVDQTQVRALTLKVNKTGADADGQVGINGYVEDPEASGWTSASFSTADENGVVTVALPNGIAAETVTLKMYWADHNTVLTVSDLAFVLDDGTEVPFYTEPEESESSEDASSEDASSEDASSEDASSEVDESSEEVVTYTVNVRATSGCTAWMEINGVKYYEAQVVPAGTEVTFKSEPTDGKHGWKYWDDNLTGKQNISSDQVYTITIDKDTELWAYYAPMIVSEDLFGDYYTFYQVNADKTAIRFVHKVPEYEVNDPEIYPEGKIKARTYFRDEKDESTWYVPYNYFETNKAYKSIYVNGHKYTSDGDLFFVSDTYDGFGQTWYLYCGFYAKDVAGWHAVSCHVKNW